MKSKFESTRSQHCRHLHRFFIFTTTLRLCGAVLSEPGKGLETLNQALADFGSRLRLSSSYERVPCLTTSFLQRGPRLLATSRTNPSFSTTSDSAPGADQNLIADLLGVRELSAIVDTHNTTTSTPPSLAPRSSTTHRNEIRLGVTANHLSNHEDSMHPSTCLIPRR